MADTFDSRLKLRLQESGANSGQWGTLLNQTITNIASVFGFGTHQLTSDADATLTLSDDGASVDALKSSYLKITSSVSLTATRTLQFSPNTLNQVKYIENATSGSQSITISQGSGANVTIASGKTAVVYFDGAGSGAAVVDALAGVDPGVTDTLAEVLSAGNATGGTDIAVGTGDDITFANSSKAIFGAGSDLQIYHDGGFSYIREVGTGDLRIAGASNVQIWNSDIDSQMANFTNGGAATLYHSGSAKLATTSTGIDVTGNGIFSGNLGIGTSSSPTERIHIQRTSGTGAYIRIQDASGGNYIGTDGGVLQFLDGSGSEKMRISGGKVGIADSDPAAPLSVSYTSNFANPLVETNAGVNIEGSSSVRILMGTNPNSPYEAYIQASNNGSGFPLLLNPSGGNVGVGVSNPQRLLTVSTSGAALFSIVSTNDDNCQVMFGDSASDTIGKVVYDHSDNHMRFETNGSEAMRITGSGQLVLTVSKDDTTSDAANMNIRSADGLVRRSTSSRRYKNTITDATHGLTELLALRPVTYKGNNDGDRLFGGLIAEEVHDAGLTEFVQYDSDDEPDALAYGHMVSLCIKSIQEQQTLIETLTDRVAALENN